MLTKIDNGPTNDTSDQGKKIAYSSYFEVQLEQVNFGLSRAEHNRICNAQLLEQVRLFESEGRQFCSEISNNEFIDNLIFKNTKSPGNQLFTWEHCSSSTANGRQGVMRLVPNHQHSKRKDSAFWKTIQITLSSNPKKHARQPHKNNWNRRHTILL